MAENRGRPAFKATKAKRDQVEQLVSCGMTQSAIAKVIGCSLSTLKEHFADELDNGLARKRAEIVAMLYDSAKTGNVSAQKKLEEMSRLAGAEAALDAKPERAPKLGKKEEAEVAAKTAGEGSVWGDDLLPPGVRPN